MHVYLLTFWLAAAMSYLARKRKESLLLGVAFAAFLLLFTGLRGNVGCDTLNYQMRYQRLYEGAGWWEKLTESEGLFSWLNMAMIRLGASYQLFQFVCALIFVGCALRFATLYRRPLAVLVLLFPVMVVQLSMSGLRQALATAFLMLAVHSFVKGRRLAVALWIVIAWQFHSSAILFLPIALLAGRKVSVARLGIAMLIASPFIAWFLGARLEVYSDRYVEQIYGENSASGAWLRYVLVVIPFIALEWKRRLVRNSSPELFELLRLFALITFAMLPMGLVSSVALHRLVFYVMPVSILALLCVADSVFARSNKRVAQALPYLAYGGYITLWFMASSHSRACYVPYETGFS